MGPLGTFSTHLYTSGLIHADSLFDRLLYSLSHWRQYMPVVRDFLEQVVVIFKNPRRYPREAVVIMSTVLLSFILVLLLVLLALALKKQFQVRKAAKSVRKKIPREEIIRRLTITGGVLAILVFAISVGTAQPGFCRRCHTITKSHSQWEKSVHKDIGCLSCHYEPGLLGYVEGNITGVENVLAVIFKDAKLPRAVIRNSSCLRCHNDVFNRIVFGEREIKVRHKDLIEGGITCTKCHPDVAHTAKTAKTFAMNTCIGCHNNKIASSKCSTCHQQDIGYKPGRSLDDWPKVKNTIYTCTGCHKVTTEARCVDCHGLVLPHSDQFKQKHAMEADEGRFTLCYKCHWSKGMSTKRMCGCHSPDGDIHGAPEGWYYEHRAAANQNGMSCNCHGFVFCERCHDDVNAVYPGGLANQAGNAMHGGWATGMAGGH